MTKNFCCIKTKEKGKATAQKQECGWPSLQPSLRSHTHAFLADSHAANKANFNTKRFTININ